MSAPASCDGFLDTSVIVRYLTDDPPHMAQEAARLIDSDVVLAITDVALTEAAYVLTSVYRLTREDVVDALVALLQRENIGVHALDKGRAIHALLMARPSGRISFADSFIWAAAQSSGTQRVYTFDERFPAEGIELMRPE
ncbi:MAG: PIN domain-containing protein [Chloroflexi bacterium]|nr:PIN domain-containing protein [Chloroflexota bacterium]